MADQSAKRFEKLGIALSLSQQAIALIASQGEAEGYGVRPLRRYIRHQLEDQASALILEGKLPPGSRLQVDCQGTELTLSAMDLAC